MALEPIKILRIRTGSQPGSEKSCIAAYYRQFSTNINIIITIIIPVNIPRDKQNWY